MPGLSHLNSPFVPFGRTVGDKAEVWIYEKHPNNPKRYRYFYGGQHSPLNDMEFAYERANEANTTLARMTIDYRDSGFERLDGGFIREDNMFVPFLESDYEGALTWALHYPEWDDGLDGMTALRCRLQSGESVELDNGRIIFGRKSDIDDTPVKPRSLLNADHSSRGSLFF